jgi:hypothetical protein
MWEQDKDKQTQEWQYLEKIPQKKKKTYDNTFPICKIHPKAVNLCLIYTSTIQSKKK